MPGSAANNVYSNCIGQQVTYVPSITYPTLGTSAGSTLTVNVTGVLPGDFIIGQLVAPPAHLYVENCYCATAGVVTVSVTSDATGISTGSTSMAMLIMRPEGAITAQPTGFT